MIMLKNNKKDTSLYWYASILIIILASAIFLFYKENNQGILKINTSDKNLQIFIDEKDNGLLEKNILKLRKGEHSIILVKENYWPWATNTNIDRKQISEINPFFVPQNTNGFIVPKSDPEYYDILNLFQTRKTHIDWSQEKNTPKELLTFEVGIKSSDFYKDRTDVIVISTENGIYAMEINTDYTPNFQPIYKGINPDFMKKNNDSIYILDEGNLMEVVY